MKKDLSMFYIKLMQYLKLVSSSYEEQIMFFPKEMNVSYIIADMPDDYSIDLAAKFLLESKIINNIVYEKTLILINNIGNAEKILDSLIWTHEGLQNHPFWDEQRRLAKEVLNELEELERSGFELNL